MNEAQARSLAKRIFDEFDKQILEATKGTHIPPKFIAGLIANEAGKDRQGNIRRAATRFEPHVYKRLVAVSKNSRSKYGSITHADLKDASDAALRALATSHEATQMMGYHVITLGCTLADLKNPAKHFFYTVKLLQLNGFPVRATEARMDDEMRQWNTGREKGKTYHASYVPNAQKIRAAYAALEKGRTHRTLAERVALPDTPVVEEAYVPEDNYMNPVNDPRAEELPQIEEAAQPGTQIADQIINTGDTAPPAPEPTNLTQEAPPKDGSTATATKMTIAGITIPAVLVGGVNAIKDGVTNGYLNAAEIGSAVLGFVTDNAKYVLGLVGLIIVLQIVKKAFKQLAFLLSVVTKAVPGWNNVTIVPSSADAPVEVNKPWWRIW